MPITLVTGSASGIGAAVCQQLQEAGHQIIGVDRNKDDNFTQIAADLSTESGRAAAIISARQLCDDKLDGLVCCAGVGITAPSCDLIVSVNYFGVTRMIKGLESALAKGDNPAVVVIGSVAANQQLSHPDLMAVAMLNDDEAQSKSIANESQQPHIAYAASKYAVTVWCRQLSVEWGPKAIRINVVAPGAVETPLHQSSKEDPRFGEAVRNFVAPIGRNGNPQEIASSVAFLQSPAASFIHGSVLFVDGGMDALMRAKDF